MRSAALSLLFVMLCAGAAAQSDDTSDASNAPTGGWQSCADATHRRTAAQEIAACTRVLDNTQAELWRGAAFWWRGIAQRRAGQLDASAADFASAFAAYSHYIETTPRSYSAYFQRAQLLAYMQRYDEALRDYDAADQISPHQPETRHGRGDIAFARGDYALAIAELDAAAQTMRRRSSAGFGSVHTRDGNQQNPGFDPLRCMARAAAGVDLDIAQQICDGAVRDSNGDADALAARGFLRFKQNRFEDAASDFNVALQARPDVPLALLGRGVLRVRGGDAGGGDDIARARTLAPGIAAYENAGLRTP